MRRMPWCYCSMVFSPNSSPLAGREGTHLTGSKIGERLKAEAATSVSLRVRLGQPSHPAATLPPASTLLSALPRQLHSHI